MMTFEKQGRQGDVFLVRVDTIPDGAVLIKRENGKVVLAHGEVTGHAHAISEKHVRQFRAAYGAPTIDGAGFKLRAGGTLPSETYLEVTDKPCCLMHEEHAPIEIQPGTYIVRRQREYVRGEIKRVAD